MEYSACLETRTFKQVIIRKQACHVKGWGVEVFQGIEDLTMSMYQGWFL